MTLSRLKRLRARLLREESGMTLYEVLVSIFIFGFVLSGILGLLDASAKLAPREQERAHAIRDVQVSLDGMVRELRQSYKVEAVTSHSIRVLVRVRRDDPSTVNVEEHSDRRVQYDCGEAYTDRCTRYEARIGEPDFGAGVTVIERVLNADPALNRPVFDTEAFNPVGATYIKVRIEVPAKGARKEGHRHSIVLEDGFHARNLPRID
jgi:hypothetical protein